LLMQHKWGDFAAPALYCNRTARPFRRHSAAMVISRTGHSPPEPRCATSRYANDMAENGADAAITRLMAGLGGLLWLLGAARILIDSVAVAGTLAVVLAIY